MPEFVSSNKCVVLLVPGDLLEVLASAGAFDLSELSEVFEVLGPFSFMPGEVTCSAAVAAASSHGQAGMIGLVLSLTSVVDPSNN